MEEEGNGDIEGQPRRIEERKDAVAGEEAAQRGDVAQSIDVFGAAGACRIGEQAVEYARTEHRIHGYAGCGKEACAQPVEQRHHCQRPAGGQCQHDQRFVAAAADDAIEHLQHVQRRYEQ